MPDAPKPVTLGDLLTIGVDRIRRPATVADLVSALRADGVLVVEKGDRGWPAWVLRLPNASDLSDREELPYINVPDMELLLDALAEAQT